MRATRLSRRRAWCHRRAVPPRPKRLGVLRAFDADQSEEEIAERWGVILELGDLIVETTNHEGRRQKIYLVYLR
jgi:hypothetical protein